MIEPENDLQGFAVWLGDRPGVGGVPLTEVMDRLYGAEPDTVAANRALRALTQRMLSEGLLYGLLPDSPIGRLFVGMLAGRLVSVDFEQEEDVYRARLEHDFGLPPLHSPERTGPVLGQLSEYLTGERLSFALPLDLGRQTDFQRRVLLATSRLPRGGLATYGEIARSIGSPGAARAVGQALAHNPMPIVIPCHRVVAADGSLTGYSGGRGIETKALLLRLEGALTP